jgi:hypothetical protein
MTNTLPFATSVRAHQPDDPAARLVIFALRRMGAYGLADASVSHAYLTAFGKDFRRPLILMRTLLAEMSAHATQSIGIAPWCCSRMTPHEATLLDVLALTQHDEQRTGCSPACSDARKRWPRLRPRRRWRSPSPIWGYRWADGSAASRAFCTLSATKPCRHSTHSSSSPGSATIIVMIQNPTQPNASAA